MYSPVEVDIDELSKVNETFDFDSTLIINAGFSEILNILRDPKLIIHYPV